MKLSWASIGGSDHVEMLRYLVSGIKTSCIPHLVIACTNTMSHLVKYRVTLVYGETKRCAK